MSLLFNLDVCKMDSLTIWIIKQKVQQNHVIKVTVQIQLAAERLG